MSTSHPIIPSSSTQKYLNSHKEGQGGKDNIILGECIYQTAILLSKTYRLSGILTVLADDDQHDCCNFKLTNQVEKNIGSYSSLGAVF